MQSAINLLDRGLSCPPLLKACKMQDEGGLSNEIASRVITGNLRTTLVADAFIQNTRLIANIAVSPIALASGSSKKSVFKNLKNSATNAVIRTLAIGVVPIIGTIDPVTAAKFLSIGTKLGSYGMPLHPVHNNLYGDDVSINSSLYDTSSVSSSSSS